MSDIKNALERGRLALNMVRTSLRDIDSAAPQVKQSAASWFSTRDEGFASFTTQCEHLAEYVRTMGPAVIQGYEKRAQAQAVGTLRNAEHWQSLIDTALERDPDARGTLCNMLRDLYDPQSMAGPEASPFFTPDRGSHRPGGLGM